MAGNGTHVIKRNDSLPIFQIKDMAFGDGTSLNFNALDTALFNMRSQDGTLKITGGAVVLSVGQDICTYQWQGNDTDTEGVFYAEVEVTFNSGGSATWPNKGHYIINIGEDLN